MLKKIIINFPTNLGDSILGLPTLDKIRANYPYATITVIASPKTESLFLRNSFVDKVFIFDKFWNLSRKIKFIMALKDRYDLIVDLKNSLLPLILGVRNRTPFIRNFPPNRHIRDKYLQLISKFGNKEGIPATFHLTDIEKAKWEKLKLSSSLVIGCSSLTAVKQYPYEYLKEVVNILNSKFPIIILGTGRENEFYKDILESKGVVNLLGKTKIYEVFYLLKNYGRVLLAVDSSILHIGSYLNIPTVALFGPTAPARSKPCSTKSIILQNSDLECLPCEKSTCSINYDCMKIKPKLVAEAIEKLW
ncbi:MAG: glycosyltransferase family 9 protein [Candidatus Omnitrophica bacterium]|jgi:ADP-heptose:LPS heptosyltransferase|nr:glycosyltransferase family 9 protein [Candidatus Omnitrophota bacterium]